MQGRLSEAHELIERDCDSLPLPADHPTVVAATMDLVRVRLARGERRGIEPIARRVLNTREKALRAGDWRIAQAQSLLAAALLAERRDAEAEPLMLAAARGLKPVPGRQARERDANRARLAELHSRQAQRNRAVTQLLDRRGSPAGPG